MLKMIQRILFIFPMVLFVLIRQFYSNLLGANRDFLTALLLAMLSVLGFAGFLSRAGKRRSDLALIDIITISQFFLAAIGVWAYFVTARIDAPEAISALYYYCLAPFLIYAAFMFARFSKKTMRAALIASGMAFLVTFWVAIFEVLGIDYWLFQYDRWVLNKNTSGIYRASGLFGTHIDYGCLCFIAFCIAYYVAIARSSWFARFIALAAALGSVASMSRVWMVAIALVVAVDMLIRQSLKQKIAVLLAAAFLISVLLPIADDLGILTIVTASDSYTQESNESRIQNFAKLSQWMLHDYAVVGIGPGSQNGPGPMGGKIASDFLWLGFIVDYGTLSGIVLVLLRVVLLISLVTRSIRSHCDRSLRLVAVSISLAFFFASFVDSAFVHPVIVSLFYMIAGIFLYSDRSQKPASHLAAEVC